MGMGRASPEPALFHGNSNKPTFFIRPLQQRFQHASLAICAKPRFLKKQAPRCQGFGCKLRTMATQLALLGGEVHYLL